MFTCADFLFAALFFSVQFEGNPLADFNKSQTENEAEGKSRWMEFVARNVPIFFYLFIYLFVYLFIYFYTREIMSYKRMLIMLEKETETKYFKNLLL